MNHDPTAPLPHSSTFPLTTFQPEIATEQGSPNYKSQKRHLDSIKVWSHRPVVLHLCQDYENIHSRTLLILVYLDSTRWLGRLPAARMRKCYTETLYMLNLAPSAHHHPQVALFRLGSTAFRGESHVFLDPPPLYYHAWVNIGRDTPLLRSL